VHLAAQKSIDKSIESPSFSARENILGLVNILQGAKIHKVKRVLAASTAAVYGYNDNFPLSETEVPDPQSPYALEKVPYFIIWKLKLLFHMEILLPFSN
jgi:nucleoside-diphosphate-sugar epimerase